MTASSGSCARPSPETRRPSPKVRVGWSVASGASSHRHSAPAALAQHRTPMPTVRSQSLISSPRRGSAGSLAHGGTITQLEIEPARFMERVVISSRATAMFAACRVPSSCGIELSNATRTRDSRSDHRLDPSSTAMSAIFTPTAGRGPFKIVEPTATRSTRVRRPSTSDRVTRAAFRVALVIAGVTGRDAIMRESRGNVHDRAACPGLNGHRGGSDVGT